MDKLNTSKYELKMMDLAVRVHMDDDTLTMEEIKQLVRYRRSVLIQQASKDQKVITKKYHKKLI